MKESKKSGNNISNKITKGAESTGNREQSNSVLRTYIIIQHFLDRCPKRRFASFPVSIKDLLFRKHCKILKGVTSVDNHSLRLHLPPKKENKCNLRKKQCAFPNFNTEGSMTSYVIRLIFKHKLNVVPT